MTCNQLMTLLACYRGTLEGEMQTGTYHEDIEYLTRQGLLDEELRCTWGAVRLVEETLEKLGGA